MMTLALKDFAAIRDEVYRKLGLFFEDSKVYFLQKRIEKRMEMRGVESFADYAFLLRYGDKEGQEMQALANLVTTNETYMFREFEQLQSFADHCLPTTGACGSGRRVVPRVRSRIRWQSFSRKSCTTGTFGISRSRPRTLIRCV
jgi:chemotaxis protein methyltransferase CheR